MKSHKRLIVITSVCVLLPVLAGVALWGRLPERVPTHFNVQGDADGWSGKAFAVFGLPLFLLIVHSLCAFFTLHDPKKRNVSAKIFALVLWICPAVSLFAAAATYSHALGYAMDVNLFGMLFVGGMFVVVGNYLPKCRQNYTVGIKLPWTLADEDNWNRTHRIAGPLWVAGGAVVILDTFLQIYPLWVMTGTLVIVGVAPVVYSAALYARKRKAA